MLSKKCNAFQSQAALPCLKTAIDILEYLYLGSGEEMVIPSASFLCMVGSSFMLY